MAAGKADLAGFYRHPGEKRGAPYSLETIWSMSDAEMEDRHDFIQWMFPLDTPSQFNLQAPILTLESAERFRTDPEIQMNLRRSLGRFLSFLGIEEDGKGGYRLARNPDNVWGSFNHNHLRITRVLRCLGLTGLKDKQDRLWILLKELAARPEMGVEGRTLRYWEQEARAG